MMKTKIYILLFIGVIFCFIHSKAQSPTFFVLDATTLKANKEKIKAKDPTIMPAYQQLLKDADEALAFGPVSVMEKKNNPPSGDKHDYMSLAPYYWPDPSKHNGIPYIRKDGETNPEVKGYKDKEYMPKLCENVYCLSLAYYFSNDQKYATHASKLLRVWFLERATKMNPNLNYSQAIRGSNDGRGAGIIDSRHFIKLIDGIGLLGITKSWTVNDLAGMRQWFADYLTWMQTSKNGLDERDAGNNHGVWYDAQRLSMALFTNNVELANKVIVNVQHRIDVQQDNEGNFPLEMARTNSFHYSIFVLEPLCMIAQMAEKVNKNLWAYTSASGKSLQKGFEALKPYLQQEKKWQGQQIKDFDFDEAIPLLTYGTQHFTCTTCSDAIKKIAGNKTAYLRINLITKTIN